jgi:hypothetical protein
MPTVSATQRQKKLKPRIARRAEQRKQLFDIALSAEQEVAACGRVYEADKVFAYMRAKAAGIKVKRLKTVRL